MPSIAERPRSSQEALLLLEKDTGSPATQLAEAATIIGIDLTLCTSHPEINRPAHAPRNAAPKEEWVLRWLLKKLKTAKNYRVDATSFLLLRQLIDLVPTKALATTLRDQKFLGILNNILNDLWEDVSAMIGTQAPEPGHSGSESSHTLPGSPINNGDSHKKKGTKRKRTRDEEEEDDDHDAIAIGEEPQPPASCFLVLTRVLDCIYGLVALVNKQSALERAENAYLKHALKGEPDSLGLLLGNAFRLATVAATHLSDRQKTTDLQHLLYVLPSTFDLWDLRSSRQDDGENKSSNDSFAKYCFRYALRLQLCMRSLKLDTDERTQVVHGIESLIALHVVLPARSAFFDRGGSGIDYSSDEPDWSSVKPVSEIFRPLFREPLAPKGQESKKPLALQGETRESSWNTAELLPELFGTAARSVPRDTFRQQTQEAPWLETLFVALAELAFSVVKEENASYKISDFVLVLEQLFRVAHDRKVQLSLHTLLTHASYTGLLKDDLKNVQWNLTALLIKLGVDIFLPNSGLTDSSRLLDSLLKNILLQWQNHSSYDDGKYQTIKDGVVVPLLRGFATARDLPTFIQVWQTQLAATEEARSQNAALNHFAVWEDDDLCDIYSDIIKTSLVDSQVATQIQIAATHIKGKSNKISESPDAYARFVTLEATFRSRKAPLEDGNEDLKSILETVARTLSSKQSLHWRWRLWRFLQSLLIDTTQSIESILGSDSSSLIDAATKSIRRLHKDLAKRPGALLEAFEAYRFALVSIQDPIESDQLEKFDNLTADITEFIKLISAKDVSRSMKAPWNGRIETLDSPVSLALGYILTLVRNPSSWAQIKSQTRRFLFEHLLFLATVQHKPSLTLLDNASSHARFLQAWASIVCHEYLFSAPCVANDLIAVLCEKLKGDPSHRPLNIESIQRIPGALITRRQRGVLLDILQETIVQKDSTPEATLGMLSLMAKLADLPKSAATLTSDWEPVWTISRAITLKGTEMDLQIMKSLQNLLRIVISKLLVSSNDDRQKLFSRLYRRVSSKTSKMKAADVDSMEFFLLRISLRQLWDHRSELSGCFEEAKLDACRRTAFELVLSDMKRVKDMCKKQQVEGTVVLIKMIDALEDFEDYTSGNSEVERFLAKIESYVEKSVDSGVSVRKLIGRRILTARGPEENISLPTVRFAETLPAQQLYGEEQQLFVRTTTERFRSMSSDHLTQIIREIRGELFGDKVVNRLLVAGLAVASLPPIEDKESTTAKELSLLCTAITESLPGSTSVEQFSFATECLEMLLRNQSRCMTQWNIDGLLAAITVSASKSGPRISPEFAATVYTRLCRLTGVLFGLHRQKLGGRFHLILPAMQRLLDCLFARGKKRHRSMRSEIAHGQPYWLAPLQASHAVHFTRLLTSLCDPTVSAVSRPNQSAAGFEGLTDQTKKAKRIAGQYLQYLIMEYAQCSLRGSLVPEVKAAIMPGLYAILDVMSRDTMRALNAGLDVSGRAVFKALYDDYVKFGKWNKG
ncbi:hypothetical protein ASPZODRAFT_163974 [Penicilliopsis zonata CBS 506.65]|uniref:Nucleolar 27S pre-rRNA processing Urb2/Npa2 C-terminal domain-containing protein n=1 Tax=Penicilliopsis zonata CBS 506.65 TaxID=1073090 RepID=A0A1L9SS34_9EURO|nr:hypothetical protein ASPZODRAFT_163974 [Penicilliopsis zonata CBS 506.65]OJJ49936.1 hypothetical protein ASPZODRAFT_163974 [Penicilliopsis zonata CBS 506.65]